MIISSRRHPLIQLARALHSGKGRRENGLFLIEGRNAVAAALESEFPLREILAAPNEHELSERALDLGLPVRRVESEILAYAGEAQTATSILAFGELPVPSRGLEFPASTLVLDGISDPGNVGTLWRAADAAGMRGVASVGGADPFSPKVVRSAAGSLFHLPPLGGEDVAALIETLSAQSVPIVTAEAHGGQNCFGFAWPARFALVMGHETRGISPAFAAAASARVSIPTFGRAESLNVAMAGTILMYAWAQSKV
ncbi:MAG: RNA methyltransferase [Armatimonadetes bacterium]|nr:RNA methyltransferase [Armatimonadota bacterium]